MTLILLLQIISALLALYILACVVMYVLQERFIFVPRFRTPLQPVEVATPSEDYEIATPNGGLIHAIRLRSANSKGIIFYLHGNTGSLRRWQFMAEELTSYGWDVFAIDYRGYGKSKGKRKEFFMHQDAEAAYDFMCEQFKYTHKVIYGRSLGTGFATRLAAHRGTDGVVLETPYYNLIHLANTYFPYLFNSMLLRFRFRSDKWIAKIKAPVIIFQGNKDRIVPYKSALKLYDKAKHLPHVKMVTLVGGKHNDLNKHALFRDSLREFFDSLLA